MMKIEDFLELVSKRRSVRRFKPDPVPDAHIEMIVEAGRWAMTSANGQPCEAVIVRKLETRARIGAIVSEQQEREHVIEQTRIAGVRHSIADRPVIAAPVFGEAPVIIVVCSDQRTYQATSMATHYYPSEQEIFHMNVGNVVQNMQLATAALGLGAQWVSIGLVAEAPLKKLLGIPEIFRIYAVVPVGYAAGEPREQTRRGLREIMHDETYDLSKYRSDEGVVDFIKDLRKEEALYVS